MFYDVSPVNVWIISLLVYFFLQTFSFNNQFRETERGELTLIKAFVGIIKATFHFIAFYEDIFGHLNLCGLFGSQNPLLCGQHPTSSSRGW